MPFDRRDGFGDINVLAIRYWFAALKALHHRQLTFVARHELGETDQNILTHRGVCGAPRTPVERFARFRDSRVHIVSTACRNRANFFPCCRVQRHQRRASACAKPAVNEARAREIDAICNRSVFRAGQ